MSELNLIPYQLKKKQDKNKQMLVYYKKGLIYLIILGFMVGIPRGLVVGVKLQEAYYKRIVEELNIKTVDQQINEMKKEISDYNFYINKVKTLTLNQKLAMERIREIEKFVPADVSFESLLYKEDSMIINGITSNINSIDGFAATLELSKAYKGVRVNSVNKIEDQANLGKYYKFTIMLSF